MMATTLDLKVHEVEENDPKERRCLEYVIEDSMRNEGNSYEPEEDIDEEGAILPIWMNLIAWKTSELADKSSQHDLMQLMAEHKLEIGIFYFTKLCTLMFSLDFPYYNFCSNIHVYGIWAQSFDVLGPCYLWSHLIGCRHPLDSLAFQSRCIFMVVGVYLCPSFWFSISQSTEL